MTTTRLSPKERTEALLEAALREADAKGWATLTHAAVARRAGVSAPLVVARLGTVNAMRGAVMKRAVNVGCMRVLAEGLVYRVRVAQRLPAASKQAVAAWLAA